MRKRYLDTLTFSSIFIYPFLLCFLSALQSIMTFRCSFVFDVVEIHIVYIV